MIKLMGSELTERELIDSEIKVTQFLSLSCDLNASFYKNM